MNSIEKFKTCSKCKVEKSIQNFYLCKKGRLKGKFFYWCKNCCSKEYQYWSSKNKKRISNNGKRRWRSKKKMLCLQKKRYYFRRKKEEPWWVVWVGIGSRCHSKRPDICPYYKNKGIVRAMTSDDVKFLWFRDKAYSMSHPTIHRIDSDKSYTLENCVFIEYIENAKLAGYQAMKNMLLRNEMTKMKEAK